MDIELALVRDAKEGYGLEETPLKGEFGIIDDGGREIY